MIELKFFSWTVANCCWLFQGLLTFIVTLVWWTSLLVSGLQGTRMVSSFVSVTNRARIFNGFMCMKKTGTRIDLRSGQYRRDACSLHMSLSPISTGQTTGQYRTGQSCSNGSTGKIQDWPGVTRGFVPHEITKNSGSGCRVPLFPTPTTDWPDSLVD